MAGLNPGAEDASGRASGSDRAQMFLVIAVAMAALLVVLTVVLNSAVYAGNLAARDDGVDDASALAYRNAVVEVGGVLVTHANRNNNSSYVDLQSTVETDIGVWSEHVGRHAAASVSGANVSVASTSDGTLIDQLDGSRNFTNATGTSSWELVPAASNVRAFHLNVTRTALEDPSPSNESSANALASADVFEIALDDGTHTWRVFVYQENTTDEVVVKVKNATDFSDTPCQATAGTNGHVRIDVSNGTVGGQPCPDLDILAEPSGPFDLRFERGANAAGTYSLVTDEAFADANDGDVGSVAGPPRVSYALYSVNVSFTHVSPTLRYETTVEIVPGERDG